MENIKDLKTDKIFTLDGVPVEEGMVLKRQDGRFCKIVRIESDMTVASDSDEYTTSLDREFYVRWYEASDSGVVKSADLTVLTAKHISEMVTAGEKKDWSLRHRSNDI